MIKSVIVTNYLGESLKLELANPYQTGLAISSITGLGPVKATINATEISTYDGALYNSARLSSRNIVINLEYVWGEENPEQLRHKVYKYFPIKKNVTLDFKTDQRELQIEGYVEDNAVEIFSDKEGSGISIICPNPYFYGAGKNGTTVTLFAGIASYFEFPFSNESTTENLIEFGNITPKRENTVYYQGDAEVGITAYIHALSLVKNITIYNLSTRETLFIDTDKIEKFTGQSFGTGDTIILSTIKGKKYIRLLRGGAYTNILNCIGKDSKWFQLSKGDNIFAFTAEDGATSLTFRIDNNTLYEGV